jgi:hypothetical protein
MTEMIIIQLTKEELTALINEAVYSAMQSNNSGLNPKPQIKGIHELAEFLKISPGRAQKLKNDKVIPCFQDGRLVLFDPDKVLKAMECHNESSAKKKVKKK